KQAICGFTHAKKQQIFTVCGLTHAICGFTHADGRFDKNTKICRSRYAIKIKKQTDKINIKNLF
ncbi:hypothetical protein, partial [Neisseria gonorrhoeae]